MREKFLDNEMYVQTSRLELRCDRVRVNGRTKGRVVVDPGDAVAIVAADGDQIILVEQYRYAVDETLWELPAGKVDVGESHLETAKRELAEETGKSAAMWTKLGEILPSPGYSSEKVHLFLARGLTRCSELAVGDEDSILWKSFSISQVWRLIRDGKLRDAKTIAGIHMLDAGAMRKGSIVLALLLAGCTEPVDVPYGTELVADNMCELYGGAMRYSVEQVYPRTYVGGPMYTVTAVCKDMSVKRATFRA